MGNSLLWEDEEDHNRFKAQTKKGKEETRVNSKCGRMATPGVTGRGITRGQLKELKIPFSST